jgi:hypothetical protein
MSALVSGFRTSHDALRWTRHGVGYLNIAIPAATSTALNAIAPRHQHAAQVLSFG